ncbi:DUF5103 domain-containing protein [Mucilaginibacter sp. UR6-11]|uniref:type IX secretion system plug protein n=1 Tax=Mucilaginibacter sp. UR6-11 TaxID=1435644 RepID=UPI001E3AD6C0|nr:DUF5103 domain-containing protein [Mucilaginibacter sp. UR6-11]MCC8423816.1 DUF5103 domain-containing protein [Mucilaginibacter sp. UR6-11]
MRKCGYIILLLFITLQGFAQQPYADSVFNAHIKTIEFYNTKKQASFPQITLQSGEQVLLAFDDLRGGNRNYAYTLEHCNRIWLPSNLSPAEYLQGFSDDRLTDYTYSTNTLQKYTHYELKFPNDNMSPKISGNYILKVYEDGDKSKIILTRRLYVVGNRVAVAADVVPSADPSLRQTNQKINFQVSYAGLNVQNPNNDIRVWLMQNGRNETGVWNAVPTYIRGTQLVYNDVSLNDFPGRNEFRRFDTRSLRLNSERVGHIYRDTAYTVTLLGDPLRNQEGYSFQYDNDGSFFILNQEGYEPRRDADYAHIYFSLAANKTDKDGTAYVVGKFNDYKISDDSKMNYDPIKGRFFTNLFLKQGVYDYEYIWVDRNTGKPDDVLLEGTHFETENDYQLLVYYRPVTARWDELVGYRLLNTVKK